MTARSPWSSLLIDTRESATMASHARCTAGTSNVGRCAGLACLARRFVPRKIRGVCTMARAAVLGSPVTLQRVSKHLRSVMTRALQQDGDWACRPSRETFSAVALEWALWVMRRAMTTKMLGSRENSLALRARISPGFGHFGSRSRSERLSVRIHWAFSPFCTAAETMRVCPPWLRVSGRLNKSVLDAGEGVQIARLRSTYGC